MYYTGIGSRETPEEVLSLFTIVGEFLAKKGYMLRSGGAKGADKAFEVGCDKVKGKKEIYLPWRKFENSNSNLIVKDKRAFDIAKQFHPYWHNLSNGAKKTTSQKFSSGIGSRFINSIKICNMLDSKRKWAWWYWTSHTDSQIL